MKNNDSKQTEITRRAYAAARDGMVKVLGQSANVEDYLDVAMLLTHHLLTQGGRLDHQLATRNADVFTARLKMLVDESQQGVNSGGYCAVIM